MQTFDLTRALPRRTGSIHTQRAYYRWIDRYLADATGRKHARGAARLKRMQMLSLKLLQTHLSAAKLAGWLDTLADNGQSRQGLDQARAAVVTLAELLADDDHMDTDTAAAIRDVSVPSVARKPEPERLLTPDEIRQLMHAAREMATSENQMRRNNVIASMLCTMALRRDELSAATWADLGVHEGRVMLEIAAGEFVDVPRPVVNMADRWREAIGHPPPHSPIIRRIWKGGRIAKAGLSPSGVWLIIRNAAIHAGLGHVTPDDLRRSAIATMYRNGLSVDEIQRVLRHRSRRVTERFLARLPVDPGSGE
jgi:integrase